jgi:hypothetical protein
MQFSTVFLIINLASVFALPAQLNRRNPGLGLENAIQEVGAGQGQGLGGNINNINAVKNDNENTIVKHRVKDESESSAGRLAKALTQ